MSAGVNLTFSMATASWRAGICIVVLGVAGFVAPIAYFAWWGLAGGEEGATRRRIEKRLRLDPGEEARKAIARGDLALYATGNPMDLEAPAYGYIGEDPPDRYLFRGFRLICSYDLTSEDRRLNEAAREYMRVYNTVVLGYIDDCNHSREDVNRGVVR